MKKMFILSALLLANATLPRGEGENPITNPPAGSGNDGRLTEAEWEARNQAKLAKESHSALISQITKLERQNATLEANQVPRGGRSLSSKDAAAYDAYAALGTPEEVKAKITERDAYAAHGTPEEVKTKIEAGETAQTTLTERDKAKAVADVAKVAGFKDTVLSDRLKNDGLEVLPLEKTVRDGKEVDVAYVKDAQGTKHELTEYAKQKWGDYLPALQAGTTTTTTTTAFTRQDATSTAGEGGSWVQKALAASTGGGEYKDPLQHAK